MHTRRAAVCQCAATALARASLCRPDRPAQPPGPAPCAPSPGPQTGPPPRVRTTPMSETTPVPKAPLALCNTLPRTRGAAASGRSPPSAPAAAGAGAGAPRPSRRSLRWRAGSQDKPVGGRQAQHGACFVSFTHVRCSRRSRGPATMHSAWSRMGRHSTLRQSDAISSRCGSSLRIAYAERDTCVSSTSRRRACARFRNAAGRVGQGRDGAGQGQGRGRAGAGQGQGRAGCAHRHGRSAREVGGACADPPSTHWLR